MSTINAERVNEIFMNCLFKDGEDTAKHIAVQGITSNVGFHPDRIESFKAEISSMLDKLPDVFRANGGGGMSFLEACMDKNGEQWTGMHQRMEQLFQLGIATGKAKCLLPREMWDVLPGGMPYYVVN